MTAPRSAAERKAHARTVFQKLKPYLPDDDRHFIDDLLRQEWTYHTCRFAQSYAEQCIAHIDKSGGVRGMLLTKDIKVRIA